MSALNIKQEGIGEKGGKDGIGGHSIITKVTRVDDPVASYDLTGDVCSCHRKAEARGSRNTSATDGMDNSQLLEPTQLMVEGVLMKLMAQSPDDTRMCCANKTHLKIVDSRFQKLYETNMPGAIMAASFHPQKYELFLKIDNRTLVSSFCIQLRFDSRVVLLFLSTKPLQIIYMYVYQSHILIRSPNVGIIVKNSGESERKKMRDRLTKRKQSLIFV